MAARNEPNRPKKTQSLVTTLATAFVLLSIIPLLLVSSILGYFYYRAQAETLFYLQRFDTIKAAQEVSGFIEQIFSQLEASAQVGQVSNREQQQLILEKLLGLEDALRELIWVDKAGQILSQSSHRSLTTSSKLTNLAADDWLARVKQNQRFISQVYFNEETGEPLVILAIPVKDVFGDFQGALLAEVNLKFMWDLVDQLQVGRTGIAYVVDKQGDLIAFGDTARVLKGENLSQLTKVSKFMSGSTQDELEFYSIGINGSMVVAVFIPLGTPDWAVITEIPVEEAYYSSLISAGILLGSFLLIAIVAAGVGIYASRYLTTPLLNLTQTATRLAAGEIQLRAIPEGPLEVMHLANAFNEMTAQLQDFINSLEQRVSARTHRLEIVASLGERLAGILNPAELLNQIVNQVKENFGYYHTHIYLLDDKNENLVVTEGTGKAGAEMKAKGHSIPLNAPTSLVARAARSGEIVKADNVREAADWLPNPLLSDTYSEMAVPISLDGRVVGILDVQENKIAGLDEGDISLLRSLANQISVTLRNARLFESVETTLAEAKEAQMRYQQQTWDKAKITIQQEQYHYTRPGAPALTETTLAKVKQQTTEQNQPALVTVNNNEEDNKVDTQASTAIVAPINLHNSAIGFLQLHSTSPDQVWTGRDLAIVAAVTEQLAQSAENLRLFEETRERAGREQSIREITDKLRAAPNLDSLLETAARELGQRLGVRHTVLELGLVPEISSKDNGTVNQKIER